MSMMNQGPQVFQLPMGYAELLRRGSASLEPHQFGDPGGV